MQIQRRASKQETVCTLTMKFKASKNGKHEWILGTVKLYNPSVPSYIIA